MTNKIKIGVLMGGPSKEREISLITGKAILENLDKNKYQILPIEFGKNRKFYEIKNKNKKLINLSDLKKKVDVIFIALHGTHGEDGGVQGLLECLDIKYTGSDILSSSLGMNKVLSAQIYWLNKIDTPEFEHFNKKEWLVNKPEIIKTIKKEIHFPCVLKPVNQGSAVGVKLIKQEKDLVKGINKSLKEFDWIMIQKFIKGQEATCGVIEKNGKLMALPPTHILPVLGEFYDYKAKYAKGGSTHICPADFSIAINEILKTKAILAHNALGCRGMSRTDFFIEDNTGKIYAIETNTIPGMTPVSLFPEAAGHAGISFTKMLDYIITSSL